eukprot:1160916-Pelagomonas_calceolata.AAC.10
MNRVLAPIKDFAEAYMDDINVRSRSGAEHSRHLRQLLELLRRHGLKVDPNKIQAVAGWPTPKDVHEVRQFL